MGFVTSKLNKKELNELISMYEKELEDNNVKDVLDDIDKNHHTHIAMFVKALDDAGVDYLSQLSEIYDDMYAFRSDLESFNIPGNIKRIGEGAFFFCSSLKNIVIPDTVESINLNKLFGCCWNLETVIIPNDIKLDYEYDNHKADDAFEKCYSLTNVNIPNSVDSLKGMFSECRSLKKIIIPNNVTNIGHMTFSYCEMLEDIAIPNSVKEIGYGAFGYCESLYEIKFLGTKAEWKSITKNPTWKKYSKINTIHCSDGDVIVK